MKVVAVVPIKMNNERLPGKNTKAFSDGKPLIKCILETLSNVPELDEIYVYCSNPQINKFFPNKKIKFLQRSESLDQSSTTLNEVLQSFANDVQSDIYVLAHATAPFVKKESFSKAINMVKSGDYDSAFAVMPLREFLWKDGIPFNYDLFSIPRTQDLETIFAETCGMYVYTSDLIKKENRRIGHSSYMVELSKIEACDINDSEDFEIANAIYMELINRESSLPQPSKSSTRTAGGGGVNAAF